MATGVRDYLWEGSTRDGLPVRVRVAGTTDKPRIAEHFASLSPASTYFRFFGARRKLSEKEIARFTEADLDRMLTLVATVPTEDRDRFVGVAQYVIIDGRADVAASVVDDHQRRGIGSLLLERLVEVARAHGIREFEGDVLGDNHRMLRLLDASGIPKHRTVESGVVHLTFSGEEADRAMDAA